MESVRLKSVILLSGGLDSSANLAFARHFDEPVLALTVNYGQKAWSGELRASEAFARHYQVPHRVLDLSWLGGLGRSALTSAALAVPELNGSDLEDAGVTKESASRVWVPNRNGLFLNVAAAFAEGIEAKQVVVGFNREEAATFPDNSAQFLGVANLALRYSTRNSVKVISYTEMMDKTEIVSALRNLPEPFPFDLVWSCYEGGVAPCGKCESCRRLERARFGGSGT